MMLIYQSQGASSGSGSTLLHDDFEDRQSPMVTGVGDTEADRKFFPQ